MTPHVQDYSLAYYSYIPNSDIRTISDKKSVMNASNIHAVGVRYESYIPENLSEHDSWVSFTWQEFGSWLLVSKVDECPCLLNKKLCSSDMIWFEITYGISCQNHQAYLIFPLHHLGIDSLKQVNPGDPYLLEFNRLLSSVIKIEFNRLLSLVDYAMLDKISVMSWYSSLLIRLKSVAQTFSFMSNNALVNALISLEQELSSNLQLPIPSVKVMADQVNMSHSSFKVFFKQIFKESPHRYFLKKRIDHALYLLSSTDFPIGKVAFLIGFMDPSGLTKLFQRELGINPIHYRKVS